MKVIFEYLPHVERLSVESIFHMILISILKKKQHFENLKEPVGKVCGRYAANKRKQTRIDEPILHLIPL